MKNILIVPRVTKKYNEYYLSVDKNWLFFLKKIYKKFNLEIAPSLNRNANDGKLRTYKIHLGSANILMEPNDQYLCIVKDVKKGKGIYLPFEGDHLLSLILSKALLLAEDSKIKDSTILSQIL